MIRFILLVVAVLAVSRCGSELPTVACHDYIDYASVSLRCTAPTVVSRPTKE